MKIGIKNKPISNIKIIPKIETRFGIKNILKILKIANTDIIMLDKEDLLSNINNNVKLFNKLIKKIQILSKNYKFKILDLNGVVFITK